MKVVVLVLPARVVPRATSPLTLKVSFLEKLKIITTCGIYALEIA